MKGTNVWLVTGRIVDGRHPPIDLLSVLEIADLYQITMRRLRAVQAQIEDYMAGEDSNILVGDEESGPLLSDGWLARAKLAKDSADMLARTLAAELAQRVQPGACWAQELEIPGGEKHISALLSGKSGDLGPLWLQLARAAEQVKAPYLAYLLRGAAAALRPPPGADAEAGATHDAS